MTVGVCDHHTRTCDQGTEQLPTDTSNVSGVFSNTTSSRDNANLSVSHNS